MNDQSLAQDAPKLDEQPEPTPVRKDAPKIREHPKKVGDRLRQPKPSGVTSVDVPERVQPVELKVLLENFRAAREQFLREQKLTQQQLADATEQQREELRDKLREDYENWRELQKEFQKEARERAREIREQLNQDLERVVRDGTKTGSGARPRD